MQLLFNFVLEVLFRAIIQSSEIKGNQIGKKQNYVFSDRIILYIENPKESSKKKNNNTTNYQHYKQVLQGFRIKESYKNQLYFYIVALQFYNKLKIKEMISFVIASKGIEY